MKFPSGKELKRIGIGVAFILPNLLGFLTFTLVPLLVSLYMAFTNWDLTLQNMFKPEPVRFIGLENFGRLFSQPDFWQYFGNTLFLMLGIPFSIAASLCAALLLTQKFGAGPRTLRLLCAAAFPAAGSFLVLGSLGVLSMGFAWVMCGTVALLALGGAFGGANFYRTIYYLPNFTAGVATFLLWKKMYDPQSGPVNAALQPVLDAISEGMKWLDGSMGLVMRYLLFIVAAVLFAATIRWARRAWHHEQTPYLPLRSAKWWAAGVRLFIGTIACLLVVFVADHMAAWIAAGRTGLKAPNWLTDYYWAKPAIMIMSLWISAGSTNMLLYVAGLTNIPVELYEAADIDGASRSQRFWHITWPQLAPITFFITIMSVIGGLQGGFEMARAMTQGGPGGATTTLSYFVFSEGFETGRLGAASAIAWTLFAFVLVVTLINWRFGSRMTNE